VQVSLPDRFTFSVKGIGFCNLTDTSMFETAVLSDYYRGHQREGEYVEPSLFPENLFQIKEGGNQGKNYYNQNYIKP